MGIVLYGMFLAIIIPPARKERGIFFAVAAGAGLSLFFHFLVPGLSFGFAVILSAVGAAVLAALFFPGKEAEA